MNERPEAIFVLLSDLHFGVDLLSEAELPPFDFPLLWRLLGSDIRTYTEQRCGAHDMAVVIALPRYLKRLLVDFQEAGFYRDSFDLYLILGDLATWPAAPAYKFLRGYLRDTEYKTDENGLNISCAGLGIPEDGLIVIPGNHDKLLHADLEIYSRHFLKPLGLPNQPLPQRCFLISKKVGDLQFVFVLVEASRYCEEELRLDSSCRTHLAAGSISSELRSAILSKLDLLDSGNEVDGIRLQDPSNAIKIMMVHYAVDDMAAAGTQQALQSLLLPHECTGLSELVEELRSRIHLVIHGHLHVPKLYNHKGVPVIAATTTTQKDGTNGFFLLKFTKSFDISVEHHCWNGVAFARDPQPKLNLPLEPSATLTMQ